MVNARRLGEGHIQTVGLYQMARIVKPSIVFTDVVNPGTVFTDIVKPGTVFTNIVN